MIRDIIDRAREYREYQKSPYADKNKTAWQYYDETSWFRSGDIWKLIGDILRPRTTLGVLFYVGLFIYLAVTIITIIGMLLISFYNSFLYPF